MNHQPGILAPIPPNARYLSFDLAPGADPAAALAQLAGLSVEMDMVTGFGCTLLDRLGLQVPGMHEMPHFSGKDLDLPCTPMPCGAG